MTDKVVVLVNCSNLEEADDNEVMVMIKTSRERLADLEKEVVRLHSYAVPEVIALQVVDGSQNYLNWIEFSLSGKP